jgi:hypothetical protein
MSEPPAWLYDNIGKVIVFAGALEQELALTVVLIRCGSGSTEDGLLLLNTQGKATRELGSAVNEIRDEETRDSVRALHAEAMEALAERHRAIHGIVWRKADMGYVQVDPRNREVDVPVDDSLQHRLSDLADRLRDLAASLQHVQRGVANDYNSRRQDA